MSAIVCMPESEFLDIGGPKLLDAAKRIGHHDERQLLCLEYDRYIALRGPVPSRPVPSPDAEPRTFFEAARQFIEETRRWRRDGFPLADKSLRQKRQAVCNRCEHWRPRAYGLLGACDLCHCTKAKTFLLTSRCPASPPRW